VDVNGKPDAFTHSHTHRVPVAYSLFATTLGTAAVAWSEHAIVRTFLPEPSAQAARARLARRLPHATEAEPPEHVRRLIDDVVRLLQGDRVSLEWVMIDDGAVPELDRRVYAATRTIPPGSTRTYGDVARLIGDATLARRVGEALGRNPFPIVVPCHRVLAAGGRTGGFSARGGTETKMELLRVEGAVLL
jgi:methylated-DNA-[protein]-cysteine S-methyltransferase